MNQVGFFSSLFRWLSPRTREQSEPKTDVHSVKVFGIGLPKTGTTTLGMCFQQLGYKHCSYQPELTQDLMEGNLERLYQLADTHDSFEDHPWMWHYKELATCYPDAKFVLTTRESGERWMDSAIHHDQRQSTDVGDAGRLVFGHYLPGVTADNLHDTHSKRVLQFFSNRPDRLLEVCWERDPSWNRLCEFIGKPIPNIPFPHENRRPEENGIQVT